MNGPPPRLSRRELFVGSVSLASAWAYRRETRRAPEFLLQWGRRGKAEGEFDIPIGLAINRRDEILVTEFRNNRLQRFDATGRLKQVIPLPIEMPGGIAADAEDNIYVSYLLAGKISVHDSSGRLLRVFGAAGTADGEMSQPGGLAIDRQGLLHVADEVNHRIQVFTPEGRFVRKWGRHGNGPGEFGGKDKPQSRVGGPQFVAVDSKGYLYTTEAANGRIQKFTALGKYKCSWGSNSQQPGGFGGREKNLPGPIAIAFDRDDHAWVSSTNDRVQEFTADGRFLRGWGGEGAEPGQFRTPHGVAFDSKGCLYVCDTQNARIQKFRT